MNDYINNFLFTYFPYIALTIFFFGFITRLVKFNKTVQAESTQFLADNKVKLASNLFHVGIIFVFFGHLTLFLPEWLYHMVMTTETKRMIALSMGSVFWDNGCCGNVYIGSQTFWLSPHKVQQQFHGLFHHHTAVGGSCNRTFCSAENSDCTHRHLCSTGRMGTGSGHFPTRCRNVTGTTSPPV